MVALPNPTGLSSPLDALHQRFLALVPQIETHARIVFRHVPCPQRKDDCIAETVALTWKWFCRLDEQGKDAAAFVSGLATLAVRAVKSGRRACGQEKAKDVLSSVAQRRHGFMVERLPHSTRIALDDLYGDPHGQRELDAMEERLRDNTQTPDSTTFSVGTGFFDAEREDPPPVGSLITFRYQELSEGGVPRFPSFVGVCEIHHPAPPTPKGDVTMPNTSSEAGPATWPPIWRAAAFPEFVEFVSSTPRVNRR